MPLLFAGCLYSGLTALDREQNSCQFRGLEEPGKLTYFNSLRTEQSTEQRAAIMAMR